MLKLPVLPPMRCDEGCGECCGPVPVTQHELDAIRRYVAKQGIVPKNQGPLTCPFYDGKCAIYPVRPLICKVYGHTKGLACHRGYNVNALPDTFVHKLIRQRGKAVGFLTRLFSGVTLEG